MTDNVLWIITDDQMRSTLRTMDRTWRRLVRKAVHFRRGYSAMPLCGPARASILTSRYPHNHGCNSNMTHPPFVAQGHDRDTVATRIKEAGYDTGYFGEYMNGLAQQPTYVAPGWDRWVALLDGIIDDPRVNVDGTVRQVASQRDFDQFAAKRLRSFIRRHQDTGPWFAVFAPTAPTAPPRRAPSTPTTSTARGTALVQRGRHERQALVAAGPPRRTAGACGRSTRASWRSSRTSTTRSRTCWTSCGAPASSGGRGSSSSPTTATSWASTGSCDKSQPYEEAAGIPFAVRGPGVEPRTVDALVSQVA